MRKINPVFVARTIEQSTPSLKNTLINFLLLRREPVHKGVMGVIQAKTATLFAAAFPSKRGHQD